MDNISNTPRSSYQNNFPPRPVPNPSSEPNSPQPPRKKDNNKAKRVLSVISIVFATIAAFGAGYYIQALSMQSVQKELDSSRSQNIDLQKQVSDLQKQESGEEEKASESSLSSELIPGNVDTSRDDKRVLIGAIFKRSLNPSEIWIEYGTDPTSLNKTTEKNSQELGMGDEDEEYATGVDFFVNSSDLESGTTYYYRVGATANGDTRYSSVASFTTMK